jgi:precorrin-3B synthase
MTAGVVRGACPGISSPMQTGDGLLVRLVPKQETALEAFIALCELSHRHGNGVMEITSRGNIQVRGLTEASACAFAASVMQLDVAEAGPVPLVSDPLPHDPDVLIDMAQLIAEIRDGIEHAQLTLAPKISIALDGGGKLHLDALSADIRLRAFAAADGPRLFVSIAGDAVTAIALGTIAPVSAAEVVVMLLAAIAKRGPSVRASDILRREGIDAFFSVLASRLEDAPTLLARGPAEPVGEHPLRHGRFARGVGLPFGQADAEQLAQLARAAGNQGATSLRPAPGRALLLNGLQSQASPIVAATAEALGFIVRPDDPRRRIVACPGKPACASGYLPARALAAELARELPPHSGLTDIHISGCCKGCAHPSPAQLTLVGDARGCAIIQNGSASSQPVRYVDPRDLANEIARATPSREAVHG